MFVNDQKIYKLDVKNIKLREATLKLGAFSGYYFEKGFVIITLDGRIYNSLMDSIFGIGDVINTHKYLIKKDIKCHLKHIVLLA